MATSDYCEDFCCPICCDVLQEPFLTECCGQHFCADCIAKAKRKVNRCPYCQKEPLNGIINKHFRRQLQDITNDDSEQGLREQQTSEHEFSEVSHTPEIACGGQESSGQDLNEQPIMCMDVNERPTMDVNAVQAMERRVDNTVQLATTVSGTGLGGVGATLGGVAVGAAIGSVVPGVGTLIGGAIGGIAGGISGVAGGTLIGFGVGKIANKLRKKPTIRDTLNRTPFPTRPRT